MTDSNIPDASNSAASEKHLRSLALSLALQRGPDKTICPSEVARRSRPASWRDIMPAVHRVLNDLRREGLIEILQKGEPVTNDEKIGPYRFRRKV